MRTAPSGAHTMSSNAPSHLSKVEGTHTYTPIEIATGYAILANEGFKVEPWLIDRIENAKGEIVYAADPLVA